jgi:hypothetical protein
VSPEWKNITNRDERKLVTGALSTRVGCEGSKGKIRENCFFKWPFFKHRESKGNADNTKQSEV